MIILSLVFLKLGSAINNFPLLGAGLFHCLDRKSEGIESSFEEKHALLGGGQTTKQ